MSEAVLEWSARLEPGIWCVVAAIVVIVGADRLFSDGIRRRPDRLDGPITRRMEGLLLAAVVAIAAFVRVVGWDRQFTPVFWFSQVPTLQVAKLAAKGLVWDHWLENFRLTQVGWAHDSVFVLPVIAGLQRLLGARFGVPVLGGAVFGVLAVVIAWAVGRSVRSPVFGLVLAALVAVSPLEITWSRIGAYYIAGVAHILLALLVGWAAGRRGSVALAIVAGAVAWASVYQYYVARVAIPLTLVAILAGGQRGWMFTRGLLLVVVALLTFAGIAYAIERGALPHGMWPQYGGYAGNKGEHDLVDFIRQNVGSMRNEVTQTFARYFAMRRVGWSTPEYASGMRGGGLALAPTILLGALGLVSVASRLKREWLWLAVAMAGVAIPALSTTTARRVLVFDLAWSAFAAHGLLDTVDWLGAEWSRTARARAAAAVLAGIAIWSVTAVFALSRVLPAGGGQHIPFGDAGFGDGITCRRCVEAAKEWQRDIAGGDFVVLFDNDMFLENATDPGGLMTYGAIAALAAGAPDRFREMYSVMAKQDGPGGWGEGDKTKTTFADHLADVIERSGAKRIVWHFERPTSWERWLARELVAAGGTSETFPTALSPQPGVRVVTPPEKSAAALGVLRELGVGLRPDDGIRCTTADERSLPPAAWPIFLMAGVDRGEHVDWLLASWLNHRFGELQFSSTSTPIAAWVGRPSADDDAERIELLGAFGGRTVYEPPTFATKALPQLDPAAAQYVTGCAAYAGGTWWVLEASTAKVVSAHPNATAIPSGPWLGIAASPSGELVLAAGDQQVLVWDPVTGKEVRRFPARVSPRIQQAPDECAPVVAGADWIATANLRTGVASLYDRNGHDLGTMRLDQPMGNVGVLTAFGGTGHVLGAAAGGIVRTWELHVDPVCADQLGAVVAR